MEQKCGCCQETETEMITIDLTCANGETKKYSFMNVKSCKCADSTCNKGKKQKSSEEGSSEDDSKPHSGASPVTKQVPRLTNKPMKTTGEQQNKKGNKSENSEENDSSEENNKSDSKDKVDINVKVSSVTKQVPRLTEKPVKTTKQQ